MWDLGKYKVLSPYVIDRRTPRLRVDNFLSPLVQTFEDDGEPTILAS